MNHSQQAIGMLKKYKINDKIAQIGFALRNLIFGPPKYEDRCADNRNRDCQNNKNSCLLFIFLKAITPYALERLELRVV